MERYEVVWLMTPWLQRTWSEDVEERACVAPAVLFVSRRVRNLFLGCMRQLGGIAWFPCESIVYELHVHCCTLERHPGVPPSLPLYWEVFVKGHCSKVAVMDLWTRTRRGGIERLYEDAREVMPGLHDGSECAYDFDMCLRYLELGSLVTFYRENVAPMLGVLDRLSRAEREYRMHTHAMGLRKLCKPTTADTWSTI